MKDEHDAVAPAVSRQDVYEASARQSIQAFRPTPRRLPAKIAIACRMLAIAGHNQGHGLASQISARDGDNHFWTQSYGLALEEALTVNQLRVDHALRVSEGAGMANPANRFHGWIYRERPDVGAIVHTHAPASSALALTGQPLVIAHMDTVPLYRSVAHLPEWPGVPFGDGEGALISQALGGNKGLLLAHHGLLTVGRTIEEACLLAITFEQAARMQLEAMATGLPLRGVRPELGDDARSHAEQEIYALAHFEYYARTVQRRYGELDV